MRTLFSRCFRRRWERLFLGEDEWSGDSFFKDFEKQNGGESQVAEWREYFRLRFELADHQADRVAGWVEIRTTATSTDRRQCGSSGPQQKAVQCGRQSSRRLRRLTNEGVIRLVEAGFSEGTIIKRIEESPVEFDLSPAKLDELFKRE